MCNAQTKAWFAEHLPDDAVRGARVLDVGSRDVNGSLKPTLEAKGARQYVGLDLVPGPGVNVIGDICSPALLPAEPFDIVVSACCLEHVQDVRAAVCNIKRCCRPGGLIAVAVPDVWPKHDYPADYWRVSMAGLVALFADCEQIRAERHPVKENRSLVFGLFQKPLGKFRENVEPLTLTPGPQGTIAG